MRSPQGGKIVRVEEHDRSLLYRLACKLGVSIGSDDHGCSGGVEAVGIVGVHRNRADQCGATAISRIEPLEVRICMSDSSGAESLVQPALPVSGEMQESTSIVPVTGAQTRPNIVVVLTDDQRYDALGVVQREQGNGARFPWLNTPNIDRLAAQSVRFRNAFVVSSLCSPSRAAFLTGQYNHTNGIKNNYTELPTQATTYATALRNAGYATGYTGKWHMAAQTQRPGFDYSASYTAQGVYYNQDFLVNGVRTPSVGWVDDITTDYAQGFLQSRVGKSNPFLLVVGYKSPHEHYDPPERLWGELTGVAAKPAVSQSNVPPYLTDPSGGLSVENQQKYFRTILGIDENLGELMTSLDSMGFASNTVFVFASDNGYMIGEHGTHDKKLAYEESIRIPLLVRYPAMNTAGKTVNQQVLNIDLAPTLIDLAGASPVAAMQGASLKPLLSGTSTGWRSSWLYEYFKNSQSSAPENYAVRTATAKLIRYKDHPEWSELFDLQADPFETKNQFSNPAYAALKTQLFAELGQLATSTGLNLPAGIVPAQPPPPPPPVATTNARINFQPAAAAPVAGYMIDSGSIYGARSGATFGWSTSHASMAVDRDVNSDPLKDTNIGFIAGSAWELAVPNGTYNVKVSVGDSKYPSSNNLWVETSWVVKYQSLPANAFLTKSVTVVVSDGRLTVGPGGAMTGATRLNYIEVATSNTVYAKSFNFQPAAATTVSGYLVDSGQIFGSRNGSSFGWNSSHLSNVYERNVNANQLLDTVVAVKAGGTWEVAVPNGTYVVKVGVGDALAASTNNLWIEGNWAMRYIALAKGAFSSTEKVVSVIDGRLTLGVGGASNLATRINFVEIRQQP